MRAGRAERRPCSGSPGRARPSRWRTSIAELNRPDAGDRAQQDAGGAALPRVQDALPRQRRPLLRQLLRLLPARGVRPEHRHVHREGRVDQRRDRQDAPLGDEGAARAAATRIIVASVSCIYGLGSPERVLRHARLPRARRRSRPRRSCSASSSTSSTSATTIDFHRGTFRVRGDVRRDLPGLRRVARAAHRVLRRHDRDASPRSIRCAAQALRGSQRVAIYPASHYVTSPTAPEARRRQRSATELQRAPGRAARREQAARSASGSSSARLYDLEMLDEMGFCHGHRELLAPPRRPHAGRAAVDPDQLLSRRLPADHRREPRHRAADRRHVPRRPLAQGDAGRVRLPPAVGARQPAAQLRASSRAAPGQIGLRVGDAGRRTSVEQSERRGRRAAHPPDRPDRSAR